MAVKHFVINPAKLETSKEDIAEIQRQRENTLKNGYSKNRELTQKRLTTESVNIKHVDGRIIISIDLNYKNQHTFADGTKIYIGRQFNNLNRRQTEPVNAIVVDAEYITKGVEILIHPNAICDANKIFNYANTSVEENNSLRYYSIQETSAFLFFEDDTWKPLKNFATGLRVFKPYEGIIHGILPTQIKDVLFITSGEYRGMVVQTLRSCDYEIIFMDRSGQEGRKIRCRHSENESNEREEIITVRSDLTKDVKRGKLFVGLSASDCKKLNEL